MNRGSSRHWNIALGFSSSRRLKTTAVKADFKLDSSSLLPYLFIYSFNLAYQYGLKLIHCLGTEIMEYLRALPLDLFWRVTSRKSFKTL